MTDFEMYMVKSQWLIIQQNNHVIRQNINISSAINSVATILSHIATGNTSNVIKAMEDHLHAVEMSTQADRESWASLSSEILRLANLMDSLESKR